MARKKKKLLTAKTKKKLVRYAGATALFGFAAGMLVLAWLGWGLPKVTDVKPLEKKPAISILAADGTLVARYGGLAGRNVRLENLPPYVPHAVLAIEDRRFYDHFGIDPLGFARAMFENVKAGAFRQGGSTLTQQLAKNLFLTADKTLRRKGQEALMALVLERRFTKDEILEAYLNRVYFGAGAYGIDAAARTYFGKRAEELNLWEGAVLAGLLKAPSRYSPSSSPRLARDRAMTVVKAMHEAGYITDDMAQAELKRARDAFAPAKGTGSGGDRYFADWILSQIGDFAGDFPGDLVVRTTFHPTLQALADNAGKQLFKSFKPEDKISQLALVTLAKDGAVLAMIGGRDYADSQFNRATQARRQPGSAFKPFVYLAALESGMRPDDRILDAPFRAGSYAPENYEGEYYGEVSLSDALAFSLNVATVRLLDKIGVSRLVDVAARAGFTDTIRSELASGLGSSEVSLLELANAYATIANGGLGVFPYAVTEVEDGAGNTLYRRDAPDYTHVFSGGDTRALDLMLQQVVAKGTGQAAQLSRGHVSGKTGTSQNYRDAWFVGYTDTLVTGIWMGNDDGTPMHRVSGGRYPARLFHEYMNDTFSVSVPSFSPGFSSGFSGDEGFGGFLNRWSSGDFGLEEKRVKPDDTPVYNR